MLPALRPYQIEIGKAVFRSVREGRGLTFSVEIARQGGKNELSAQLELYLLVRNMLRGGNIIKCSPTFKPQALISMMRLQEKFRQAGIEKLLRTSHGYILSLGKARSLYLSAEPSSNVMGATADLLLEVDEAQDVDKEKFTRDFRPMASSTNATTVLYGTTWDESSLLEEVKQRNLELEKVDGLKRHFRYDWDDVAMYNQAYRRYVEGERERLGEDHPLFLTQYRLLPLGNRGRFLTPLQLAQMKGEHRRLHARMPGEVYVAGLDLAGRADSEQGEAPFQDRAMKTPMKSSGHDAAVLTIAEVVNLPLKVEQDEAEPMPAPKALLVKVIELLQWIDEPYPGLYSRLIDIIKNVWACSQVVVDATGVGAGVASFLKEALGRKVVPFQFTPKSKSQLGFQLLSFINLGRVKVFYPDGTPESGKLWRELERARVAYRANQTMNFYVDPSEGHDDYLMSLALAVEAAAIYKPRRASGSL